MTNNPKTSESIKQFIERLTSNSETVEFEDTIAVIEQHYVFDPCAFTNGEQINELGTNLGSCKILAFADLHSLPAQATLHCFGRYYRQDVLQNPDGTDHANIRNFIKYGWQGVSFSRFPLSAK
ncbi:HopJ type III effector protein [Pseudoalteromonas sp. SMS1]|uniref:HopJ type III effector protein n=1 Tax=Pseudoalteromonas sp. SMS1 TaxID=2908894 RepID=UPI001F15D77D|nr:HopJ type III effector protein [Pseudoalteromonas sp. SMS1]MCF2860126.1 HopJ type III effector protein [Pseudoalteromonas sp. SMS1]